MCPKLLVECYGREMLLGGLGESVSGCVRAGEIAVDEHVVHAPGQGLDLWRNLQHRRMETLVCARFPRFVHIFPGTKYLVPGNIVSVWCCACKHMVITTNKHMAITGRLGCT